MNRLIKSLVNVCTRNLLAEKWLIAPSRRVGHQWLEAVTRSGTPVVNVHVKTLTSLAVDLAAQQMAARGVTLLSPRGGAFLIDRIVRRLQKGGLQYLAQLEPSAGLSESIYAAIVAIRLAGLDSEALSDDLFEVAGKGHDLRAVLQEYLAELEAGHLIDGAELLRMAVERIRAYAASLASDLLVLVPADMEFNCVEQKLIEAIPAQRRHTLPIDEPAGKQDTAATHRLREKFGDDAAVTQFGFFFPGAKAQGERIVWTREDLTKGREIIEKLVQLVSNGAFLATDNHKDDCTYCNYKGVCGDVEALAAASKLKLGVLDNHLLTPLREVRHG